MMQDCKSKACKGPGPVGADLVVRDTVLEQITSKLTPCAAVGAKHAAPTMWQPQNDYKVLRRER
jgi:hypothetical protein